MLEDKLLTAEEVADHMKVTVAWVHAMARAGEMPSLKLGRYRRFSAKAIEDWLQSRQSAVHHRRRG